jgi:hypothetical protein
MKKFTKSYLWKFLRMASAMYAYKDALYLNAMSKQKLLILLADRATNPDYNYIAKLFQK